MGVEAGESRDRQGLLSPDEIDSLDENSGARFDSTDARSRSYEGAEAYSSKSQGVLHNSIMTRFSPKAVRHLLIGIGVTLLLILGMSVMPGRKTEGPSAIQWVGGEIKDSDESFRFEKPEGIKIRGVVFYGRARFVDVLDCYLQKNLAVNGGIMDDVIFFKNTGNREDLAYLDQLTAKVPQYVVIDGNPTLGRPGWGGFASLWGHMKEDNTIYVKIDDDIIWMHDDAIPRMISSLLKHPEAHDIAGNMINSPITDFLHYHNDAVHAFMPENAPHPTDGKQFDWRVNDLPAHDGDVPAEYNFTLRVERPPSGFAVGQKGGPPYENHRWLLLKEDSQNTASAQLMKTPIVQASYDAFGLGWRSWAMAAQQHYSLLKNIEDGQTSKYWFGNRDGMWNMQYYRYNLNFMAIWGSSVAKNPVGKDDEGDLTVRIPKMLHKPCLIDTHALVAHFNFGTQPELIHTDLLDRYRAYANEMVCKPDNQKKRLPRPEVE